MKALQKTSAGVKFTLGNPFIGLMCLSDIAGSAQYCGNPVFLELTGLGDISHGMCPIGAG